MGLKPSPRPGERWRCARVGRGRTFRARAGAGGLPGPVRRAALGRAGQRSGADGGRGAGRARRLRLRRLRVRGADLRPRHVGLLRPERRRELALDEAARSTRSRGVWGNHEGSMLLWVLILTLFGAVGGARAHAACRPRLRANTLAVQAAITVRFSAVHPHRPPTPSPGSSPRRWRARTSTRCCRIPASRSIRRCFTSAMSASRSPSPSRCAALIDGRIDAVWARAVRPWTLGRLVLPDARHRHGLVLGLLRTRLGRLVVLGPGRERLADALARRHGAPALHRGDGEARRPQGLDDPACDPDLLALAARHLSRPLGRADLGARLRHRPDAGRLHPRDPRRSSSAARSRCSRGARRCCGRAASSRRCRARARSS